MENTPETSLLQDGSIIHYDASQGVYAVAIDGGAKLDCLSLTHFMTQFIGIKTNYVYPVGTRVKVVFGGEKSSVILGAMPCSMINNTKAEGLNTLTGEEAAQTDDDHTDSQRAAKIGDMVEGELDMTNMLGVGIRCLTAIAQLSGGGLASVEAIATNDMVRIISDTFRHHSAIGDEEIFHQGIGINKMEHATSYDHETWGLEDKDDKKVDLDDDLKKVNLGEEAPTGRWRYSYFQGMLGGFVHMFLSDPTVTIGEFSQAAQRAGKARVQVMNDGTLLAQSVSEIVLERVTRVPVPIQLNEANLQEEQDRVDQKLLRIWEGYSSESGTIDTVFQLREYARWLNTKHSLDRFLQRSDNWKVEAESDQATPDWKNKEEDVETQNNDVMGYYDTYACMRIMRDGAILHWCGYGSVICMSEGDINLNATRNINMTAAGDINFRAGRNFKVLAFKHLDFTSVVGGLKMKSRAWFDLLCESGRLFLKSTASDTGDDTVEGVTAENTGPYGVIIESPNAGASIISQNQILLETKGGVDPDSEEALAVGGLSDIVLRTTGALSSVQLTSKAGSVNAVAQRNVALHTGLDVRMKCNNIKANVTNGMAVYRGADDDGDQLLSLTGSVLTVGYLKAQVVDALLSLKGPKKPEGSSSPLPCVLSVTSQKKGDAGEPYIPLTKALLRADLVDWLVDTNVTDIPNTDYTTWEYPAYTVLGEARESLAEQFIRLDAPNKDDYTAWYPGTSTRLLRKHASVGGSVETESQISGNTWLQHHGGTDLRTTSSLSPEQLKTKPTAYENRNAQWWRLT